MPNVERLAKQLNSYDENQREKAAWALGETADPQARKILEEALKRESSSFVKVAIWKSFIQLGETSKIDDLIKFVKQGGELRALKKAFIAFRELKRQEAVPQLVKILEHTDGKCTMNAIVCLEAVKALKELGDQSHIKLLEEARDFCGDDYVKRILGETIKKLAATPHTRQVTVAAILLKKGLVTTLLVPCEALAYDLKESLTHQTGIPLSNCQVTINRKTLKDGEPIKAKTGDRIYIA